MCVRNWKTFENIKSEYYEDDNDVDVSDSRDNDDNSDDD